jgi:hypothetical protein
VVGGSCRRGSCTPALKCKECLWYWLAFDVRVVLGCWRWACVSTADSVGVRVCGVGGWVWVWVWMWRCGCECLVWVSGCVWVWVWVWGVWRCGRHSVAYAPVAYARTAWIDARCPLPPNPCDVVSHLALSRPGRGASVPAQAQARIAGGHAAAAAGHRSGGGSVWACVRVCVLGGGVPINPAMLQIANRLSACVCVCAHPTPVLPSPLHVRLPRHTRRRHLPRGWLGPL